MTEAVRDAVVRGFLGFTLRGSRVSDLPVQAKLYLDDDEDDFVEAALDFGGVVFGLEGGILLGVDADAVDVDAVDAVDVDAVDVDAVDSPPNFLRNSLRLIFDLTLLFKALSCKSGVSVLHDKAMAHLCSVLFEFCLFLCTF